MPSTSSQTYTLAIPGSDQLRELSQETLLEEMAQGKISEDFWIWSPRDNDWKQISEFPNLRPAHRRPTARPIQAIRAVAPEESSRPVARKKVVRRKFDDDRPDGFPYIKFLVGLLTVALAVVVALNYLWIDKPLNASIARTPYLLVPVHAHLGSFVQPTAIVLHILPTQELNKDNFADFLQKLAHGTPAPPFQARFYEVVTLTPAWFSEFAMPGDDWSKLAHMDGAKPEAIRNFVTLHLCNLAGQPLVGRLSNLDPAQLTAAKDKVWNELTGKFLSKD